jgi:hypothetical protein
LNVPILDVSPIFTQMDCDSIGSAEFGQDGGRHRIGLDGSTRLTHGGYVIDIDAQFNHTHAVC